jgi:hypothetical protein
MQYLEWRDNIRCGCPHLDYNNIFGRCWHPKSNGEECSVDHCKEINII